MDSSKRVIYFSRDYSTHDHRFLTSLSKTDYEVFYLRLENNNKLSPKNSQLQNIKILPSLIQDSEFNFWKTPGIIKKIKSLLKEIKPDIIHAGPIQTCAFLIAMSKYPSLVSMSWGSDLLVDSEQNLIYNLITRFTLKRTKVLLGDCNAVKEKAIKLGFPEKQIILFPWGINLENFKPGRNLSLRKKLNWDEKFIILSLRSWERIYGVDVVAKAFANATKREPGLRLLLLGNGSYSQVIHEIIRDAGVEDRIFYAGMIDQEELPLYYQAADLYISASFSDGSSVSLMEALATGIPVLVSDIPGNKEWIQPGENGWLFSTGNVSDLENMILEIYRQRDAFSKVSHNARATAERKANWDINFSKLLLAYQQVLNTNLRMEGI